jgi:thymidylate synthase
MRPNTGEGRYLELLRDVMLTGSISDNRTDEPTRKVFGRFWTCDDVIEDFPLLTTKRVHWKSIVAELIWFLSGSTNVKDLQAMGCTIWDEWADQDGYLGPVYGKQWRNWWGDGYYGVDQIQNVMDLLKTDPNSRRMMVSAWNVKDLDEMALQPCHDSFQLQTQDGDLNMLVRMRSTDIFLGMPFNIASYALLLCMFAHVTGFRARRLCFSLGDLHIYENHMEQGRIQLTRNQLDSPRVGLEDSIGSIFDFRPEHVELRSYNPHAGLKGEVAV